LPRANLVNDNGLYHLGDLCVIRLRPRQIDAIISSITCGRRGRTLKPTQVSRNRRRGRPSIRNGRRNAACRRFLAPPPSIRSRVPPNPTFSILEWHRKRSASELYLVGCSTQSIETLSEATGLVTQNQLGSREVTLVQLSFTSCDIWIALRGREVTFEGGRI
jgi:hypothetical protein